MLDLTQGTTDTTPLTDFRNHPEEVLSELQQTGRPVTLTIDGNAAAVLQSADAYQRLLDLAAETDVNEAIRQGDEDVKAGRVYDAADVFTAMREKYGIPR